MKNRLKKLFIASLSTACLFASNPTSAMDKDEDPVQSSSNLSAPQNLSQSFVISAEDLARFLRPEQLQELLSRSSLQNSTLSQSSMQLSPTERELRRLQSTHGNADLFPQMEPSSIMYLINSVLLPKYGAICQARIKEVPTDIIDATDYDDIIEFLSENKTFIIGGDLKDDKNLILALKMITQTFDLQSHVSPYLMHHHHYQPQNLNDAQDFTLLMACSGIIKRELVVKMDVFYKELKELINVQYYHNQRMQGDQQEQQRAIKEKILEGAKKEINGKFSFQGYDFDVEKDAKEVSGIVQNWFKVVRQLAVFELQQWEPQQVVLGALQRDYNFVNEQLQQAEKRTFHFSGVTKTTYSIGLTEVESKEQASSLHFLRRKVETHQQADAKILNDYNHVRSELSSLRKLVNWIDDVFLEVGKKGRIS